MKKNTIRMLGIDVPKWLVLVALNAAIFLYCGLGTYMTMPEYFTEEFPRPLTLMDWLAFQKNAILGGGILSVLAYGLVFQISAPLMVADTFARKFRRTAKRSVFSLLPNTDTTSTTPEEFYDKVCALVLEHFFGDTKEFQAAAVKLKRSFKSFDDAASVAHEAMEKLKDRHTLIWDAAATAQLEAEEDERGVVSYEVYSCGDTRIALVGIKTFRSKHTSAELADALRELQNVDAFVLDLRNNPGGLTDQSFRAFDLLCDGGTFLIAQGKGLCRYRYYVTEETRCKEIDGEVTETERLGNLTGGKPLLVLVNQATCSAAEILPRALVEHRNAKIVGVTTWGKETGQDRHRLCFGTSLRVSVIQLQPGGPVEPHFKVGGSEAQVSFALNACRAMVLTRRETASVDLMKATPEALYLGFVLYDRLEEFSKHCNGKAYLTRPEYRRLGEALEELGRKLGVKASFTTHGYDTEITIHDGGQLYLRLCLWEEIENGKVQLWHQWSYQA